MEFAESDFAVEIKIGDILFPFVDGDAVHLIGLEYHEGTVFEFDHHPHVVEVTVGNQALQFGRQMLCIEQNDIPSLCLLQKLILSQAVFIDVKAFV